MTGRLEVFDTHTDSWSDLHSMPMARFELRAAIIGGQLLAIGGANTTWNKAGDRGDHCICDAVEAYDPVNGKWRALEGVQTPRARFAVVV
eukprot:SAG31_NODE_33883_length_339_cov_0.650000_1_plen_90_part_00